MNPFPLNTKSKFARSGRARRNLIVAALVIGQVLAIPFLLPKAHKPAGLFLPMPFSSFRSTLTFLSISLPQANSASSAKRGLARIW
jgi:hypothetical protein